MITVAICEDEPCFASDLRRHVGEYSRKRGLDISVLPFVSGEALLSFDGEADMILMDIKLPGEDGMKIIRQLRGRGSVSQVIFITAYPEYVFQAFDLDAVHYILKPAKTEKLFPAMDRALNRLETGSEKSLLVTNGAVTSKNFFRDILYCEALDHQVTVHTLKGSFSLPDTLDSIEKSLDDSFFRCHRSYIVNMGYVVGKEPGIATVTGGDRVLISRRRQKEFTKRLLDSFRKG